MTFSFVHITDHHLTATEAVLMRGFSTHYSFRAVMRHIAAHVGAQADFIISTGDLGENDPGAAYQAAATWLNIRAEGATLPGPVVVSVDGLRELPMYFFPGNHDDLDAMAQYTLPGDRKPTRSRAMPARLHATFDHKGVRFVFLDWGRDAKAYSEPGMFEFLADALQGEGPAVVLTHHHVAPTGVAWLDDFIPDDVKQFWDTVRGKNVLGVLAGHVHMTTEAVVEGIPVLTLRSTAFQFARLDKPLLTLEPPHYRLVTIKDGLLTSQVFEVAL